MQLLKAVLRNPDLSEDQIDREAVLLRAYGNNTDVLIDRDSRWQAFRVCRERFSNIESLGEAASHRLLSQHGLAPELLARFQNGLLYKFIQGWVTASADLTRQPIWRAVAKRLAEWHAVLPTAFDESSSSPRGAAIFLTEAPKRSAAARKLIDNAAPGKSSPNLWTVMQKWIFGLPATTDAQRLRKDELQSELEKLVKEFADRPGLGKENVSRISVLTKDETHTMISLYLDIVTCFMGMS
jgi:ethanolamine kinase